MAKTLTKNVVIHTPTGDQWFGPDYNSASVPSEYDDQITNESVFEEDDDTPTRPVPGPSQRLEDLEPDGDTGGGELSDRTVKQLRALAAANDVDLEGARTKDDIVAQLEANGVSGADDE